MIDFNEILNMKLLEKRNLEKSRDYLGASMIGDDCLRKIQFRYMRKNETVRHLSLRNFAVGHLLEDMIIEWLRDIGFDLQTRDDKGEQLGFSAADGKIAGHVDGIIYGGIDEFTYPTLLEIKTMNNKSWNETKKRGVQISKPQYYAQIQLYMAYMDLSQCLFVTFNKDSSDLYFEVVPFDSEVAQKYSDRAVQIIQATENNELLPRISNDSSFFKCKMCEFNSECFKKN